MSAQTLDQLSDALRRDLGWRRKENHVFQSFVRTTTGVKQQAVLRGAIASLYAHWEGFVKSACRSYLDYVKIRKLANKELSIPFLALAFRLQLQGIPESTRLDSHYNFSEWLLSEWDRRAKLPPSDKLFGTSNLNSTVFKAFIRGLGLPARNEYEYAEKPVIDALVDIRNQLAHGEWPQVEQKDYDEFFVWIDRLMEFVCTDVEQAAAISAYRRTLAQLT